MQLFERALPFLLAFTVFLRRLGVASPGSLPESLRVRDPIGPFTCADDLTDFAQSFACALSPVQLVGADQFELPRSERLAEQHRASGLSSRQHIMLELAAEVPTHLIHGGRHRPRNLLSLDGLPGAVRQLASIERLALK